MKAKILLVDDEPDMRQALGYRLENAGYELIHATNGAEALDIIQQRRPDLILSDFMMPEMNGIELTRVVKSHPLWYSTEVMLVSCNVDPEFRRKAMALGAADYLPKSAGAKAILERVEKLIGGAIAARAEAPPASTGAAALADTLIEMLEVAKNSQSNPEAARVAIDASMRIAEEMRSVMLTSASSDSTNSQEMSQHAQIASE